MSAESLRERYIKVQTAHRRALTKHHCSDPNVIHYNRLKLTRQGVEARYGIGDFVAIQAEEGDERSATRSAVVVKAGGLIGREPASALEGPDGKVERHG